MTWIKLNDDAVDHPKVAPLSDRAFRWWIKGLSYAGRFLTDGVLSPPFWKRIPKSICAELTCAGLWEWNDPNFLIHDYLDYQSSRESVMRKRAKTADRVAHHRARQGNAVTGSEGNADSNASVTPPEIRDQRSDTDTEITEQRQQENPPPLIKIPVYTEDRLQQRPFVGARLDVPHGLHAELCRLLGGANADAELKAWYTAVDAEIVASGEAITPDVFKWLKARYATWKPAALSGTSNIRPVLMTRFASLGVRK